MKKIAFIGAGIMGRPMMIHLANKGHHIQVFTRTIEKAQQLDHPNIHVKTSLKECLEDCDTVMTMVSTPDDVASLYLGNTGILATVKPGTLLIDLTTSSPTLARELEQKAHELGLMLLDAPVSGGDIGAKNGTLSIMVGGSKEAFDQAYPLLECFGKSIKLQGSAGFGQHTKMANQISVAGNLAATCETLLYSIHAGLDLKNVIDTIGQGAGGSWQLVHNGVLISEHNTDPGFYIKHFIKDMNIVQDEAKKMGITLPIFNQVLSMFNELSKQGYDLLGTQALYLYYQQA